jgi:PAT family beta-lactamase induction signal transducer AmpG
MRTIGVDIQVVGLLTLSQAPWTFKVLWSPLMDRYVPPFWGRRRGWMAVTQVALLAFGLMLAGVGHHPDSVWVVGALALALALASASQDIAIDAYAVEVLRKDEQGAASGARTAFYRAAYFISGGLSITMAARIGWPAVNVLLALVYLPLVFLTWRSPEPEVQAPPPRSLRDAIWQPFLSFLTRPRALEILSFVVLYKLADQLAQALTRPFLIDMGYSADQRGIALATIGLWGGIAGSFVGGWITTVAGLGHALWIFGFLQMFSNIGYYLLSTLGGPNVPAMYAATGFELLTSGLGTGAFAVLLLRLTEKRFSATQFALFTSLFALPRVLSGPVAGFAVAAFGWPRFFLATMIVGIPGLVMLNRFVPFGVREPDFEREAVPASPSLTRVNVRTGVIAGVALAVAAAVLLIVLDAMDVVRKTPGAAFDLGAALSRFVHPAGIAGWLQVAGIVAFAAIGGMFVAATRARK